MSCASKQPPTRSVLSLLVLVAAACQGAEAPTSGPIMQVDTVGDTISVHTVAGAVWGEPRRLVQEVSIGVLDGPEELMFGGIAALAVAPDGTIYVTDGQAKTLRAYAPDGSFLRTLATEGQGPGELSRPDGGLGVLPDGRIAVRDPGNTRIEVFQPDGSASESWRLSTGLQTSEHMYVLDNGQLWTPTVLDLGVPLAQWEWGFLGFGPQGDSLPHQTLGVPVHEDAVVRVQEDGNTSQTVVPFTPRQRVRLTTTGHRVNSVPTSYAFDVHQEDGSVLRIGRDADPVPVAPGEAAAHRRRIERNFRNMKSDWRWNGPQIPDTKAPYRDVFVARDGRFWVLTAQPSVESDEAMWEPRPGEPDAPLRWVEPVVFDVYEPDGTYLGEVHAPAGVQTGPTPVFNGDNVWSVVRDDLGVQRVVRFRVSSSS